ncbi:MAG: VanW family protein [Candidatus Buchananbacteria bacterium]|nr:VanW family protein [Candidatus Buchananbacteria bacterium]
MFKLDKQKPNAVERQKKWLILPTIFLIIILLLVGADIAYQKSYDQRIFPGVKIGYLDVGSQTKAEVLTQLKNIEKNIQDKGSQFIYDGKTLTVHPIVVAINDPDLAKTVLTFDWSKTVDQAYSIGRNQSWWQNIFNQLNGLLKTRVVNVNYQLDENNLIDNLKTTFDQYEQPAKNAGLVINGKNYLITEEQTGFGFNYQKTIDKFKAQINQLNFDPITLDLITTVPTVKKQDTAMALNNLPKILAIDSIKLTNGDLFWKLNQPQFVPWLEFQKDHGQVSIGLNKEKVLEFLKPISETIDIQATDAKFKLTNNKVTEFQASQDGKKLDLENSYLRINQAIVLGTNDDVELVVESTPAKVTTENVNDLGIKDLVGSGSSNFAGSPKNRRVNIVVGAAAVNGTLIAPDEEFSLLKTLGEIDGEHGYLQELVIKGDRTIPEYGGGLCQIGTTAFRAALYSGLPITARQNHSYRVSYYEPPVGMDATIYDPAPDFKFVNDTGHYLLFITHIDGDILTFDLYGTKDNRQVEISDPIVYNITKPGEPRYIETDQLAPGEKKIVEHAHNGADAKFDYKVTYPDGEVKEKEFTSHYVAWKETWLVGIDPNAVPPIEPTSTTTNEIVN